MPLYSVKSDLEPDSHLSIAQSKSKGGHLRKACFYGSDKARSGDGQGTGTGPRELVSPGTGLELG